MTRRFWAAVVVLAALAMGAGFWTFRWVQARSVARAPAGRPVRLYREPAPLPTFTVTDLEGRTHSSSEWRGKVVLLNFWATWCGPCRAEIPDLLALQERYRDQLVIVGISEDDGPVDTVKRFVSNLRMTYTVAMTTPELRKIFRGIVALPTTFVLDRQGRLAQKHVGLLNPEETEAETRVLAGLDGDANVQRIDTSDKARLENAAMAKSIPGVDLAGLNETQKKAVLQALVDDSCTCGCGLTIAACRLDDPGCPVSLPLAQQILKTHSGS